MGIRSAAKVILLRDGKILVNRCSREDGSAYFDLPGGGQRPFESLEEAAVREVKEETGYTVSLVRFAALAEEIRSSPEERAEYPEYAHRILHIFLARTTGVPRETPTEPDLGQVESLWLTPEDLARIRDFYPPALPARLREILDGSGAIWLGTARL